MNKSSLMGWVFLMGLLLLWTNYKGKQAQETHRKQTELRKVDSLARLDSVTRAARAAGGDTAAKAPAQLQPQAGAVAPGTAPSIVRDSAAPGMTGNSTAAIHRQIRVETREFVLRLDNEGAKVASLDLKDLAGHMPYQPRLISPEKGGALLLVLDEQDLGKVLWEVDTQDSVIQVDKEVSVTFAYAPPGSGKRVTRKYTFFPDSGKFSQRVEANMPLGSYNIKWPSGLSETEKIVHGKGIGLMSTYFSEVVLDNGVNVERVAVKGRKVFNEESGVMKWVGLRRKYVAAVMNFNRETTNKVVAVGSHPPDEPEDYPKEYQLEVVGSNYEEKTLDFDFVILPLSYDSLLAHNQNYEKIIFSGWEWLFRADVWYVGLCGFVLKTLKFFYGFVHNYGVSIILLTLLVRLLTFPLTIAQTKSAMKMQEHAPAIRKIRDKHKGQPQKANLEIMEYYKKAGVSPFAGVLGCFPVLLQMPIFIALFNVLGRSIELKGAPFFGWIHDLAQPDVVWEGLKLPYLFPLGLTIMPFFMAGTMFFQMKMSIKDPQQKFMVWMMPVMMFVFSCSFPSGLVLYWTISNLFTITQTYFYTNRRTASQAAASPKAHSKA